MPRLLPPLVLRVALVVGLVWVLLAGLWRVEDRPRPTRLVGGAADHDRLAAALVEPIAPTAVLRDAGQDPREHALQALAAAAQRAPLFVELPSRGAALRVAPLDRPLVDRFTAIRFIATAAPLDTLTVRLLDRGALLDSLRVTADAAGSVVGAFRVRPGRAAWLEWGVVVEGAGVAGGEMVARVGAWVVEAGPPRVLVVAGPPSWESRYAVRALERSGAEVSLVQRLGRDNVITAGDAAEDWASEESLARHDVVVLLPGAAPDADAMDALEAWALEGKGVLAASTAAGRLGLGSWAGAAGASGAGATDGANEPDGSGRGDRIIRADSLVWTAPAEVAPLPAAEVEAAAVVAAGVPPGATVAARDAAGDPVLVVAPLGRGRVAGLGLRESWRWVMDAGLEAEHRAFWRSLVDWLAAPSADSLAVSVTPSEAAVGTTVDLGLRRGSLELQRPDGAVEPVAAARRPDRSLGRFVTVDTGVHVLRTTGPAADSAAGALADGAAGADGGPEAGAESHAAVAAARAQVADEAPPAELGRARLSLLAAASGGAALEPDSFAVRVEAAGPTGDSPTRWLPWIFAALTLLALAEWTLRRLSGLP